MLELPIRSKVKCEQEVKMEEYGFQMIRRSGR
jgi:hypothetical protein